MRDHDVTAASSPCPEQYKVCLGAHGVYRAARTSLHGLSMPARPAGNARTHCRLFMDPSQPIAK